MNNERKDIDPWDSGTYRTGSTKPPKSHGCLIAALLVVAILLVGIVSGLGMINFSIFRHISLSEPNETVSIVVSDPENGENVLPEFTAPLSTESEGTEHAPSVDISDSPLSVDNIPQEGGLSLQDIYTKVIDSVVSISCSKQNSSSTGTGVILSEDGYIVTNCHVVENAKSIQVLLNDGRTSDAILIGTDEISDLAVLQIELGNLTAAEMGDSSKLRVGDSVVAIGDPLGIELRGTMTDGIISAINRDIDVDGRTMNLIQTNAALNSGNSGGPLINCYGQVIGINTIKMGDSMSSAGVEGLGFAIPSSTVSSIVNQLLDQGYVSGRPSIGIIGESISGFYQLYYRLPNGLYITEVEAGSSAEKAGIKEGDILLSIDDVSISDSDSLKKQLYSYVPGDTVTVIIYRSGRQYSATLTLGEARN